MRKLKLFVYPNARPHEHDLNPSQAFVNTVPMSRFGISEHFDICDPDEADYFYMGQFKNDPSIQDYSAKNFEFFDGNEDRHIFDYEGEGGQEYGAGGNAIPDWLHNSIVTANGTLKKYKDLKVYTRPTFTNLLIDIAHNRFDNFVFPEETSMGFTGFLNSQARASMLSALSECRDDTKINVIINEFWSGPAPLGHPIQEEYILFMLSNLISLCPRGSGIDSVRLYETCYFTRVPVLISDHDYFMVGEDEYDTSFCYRICDEKLDLEYITEELQKIYDEPISELQNRANDARKYFEEIIRPYFQDPTLRFLEWLEKNER